MTTETQIAAGAELDMLIRTEVFGLPDLGPADECPDCGQRLDSHPEHWKYTPDYSTSYEGMGLVIERMKALEWDAEIASYEDGMWHVAYGNNEAESASLPHALALAALAAVRNSGGN